MLTMMNVRIPHVQIDVRTLWVITDVFVILQAGLLIPWTNICVNVSSVLNNPKVVNPKVVCFKGESFE